MSARDRRADEARAEEPEREVPRRGAAVIEPPTAAPTATNAICPRLISPAHPVSTTNDSAMIAVDDRDRGEVGAALA